MIEKPKRTKNKKNLSFIKSLPCFVCGARPSDADHVKSQGAGGGDDLSNLQALCRGHHTERHTIGIKTFLARYRERLNDARDKYDLPDLDLKSILD